MSNTVTDPVANTTSSAAADPVRDPHLLPNELAFYREHGYLTLPGLLDAAAVAALRADVMAVMDVMGLGQSKLRQTNQYLRGSHLDRFVNSPTARALAGVMMAGEARMYLPFTAVKSAAGGDRFEYHQDNQYTRLDGPAVNIWFALDDMTPENGCLYIVPGSHRFGTLESLPSRDGDGHRAIDVAEDQPLPIRLRAGDAVAFHRLAVHGSGRNTTERHRVAYALQYFRTDTRALRGDDGWIPLIERNAHNVDPVDQLTP